MERACQDINDNEPVTKVFSNTADCEKPGKECKISLYQLSGSNS